MRGVVYTFFRLGSFFVPHIQKMPYERDVDDEKIEEDTGADAG